MQWHLPRPRPRGPPLLAAARVSQVTRRDSPRRHPSHPWRPEVRVTRRGPGVGVRVSRRGRLRPATLTIAAARRHSPRPPVSRRRASGHGSPPSHSPRHARPLASARHESFAGAILTRRSPTHSPAAGLQPFWLAAGPVTSSLGTRGPPLLPGPAARAEFHKSIAATVTGRGVVRRRVTRRGQEPESLAAARV